ncbi:MAG: hypothetical protein J3Q66DRAFT_78378 [Benniella sp.]|nr:MAG: hypothetical protein J3Q66DRAFT_78378 [Benniella sp.]
MLCKTVALVIAVGALCGAHPKGEIVRDHIDHFQPRHSTRNNTMNRGIGLVAYGDSDSESSGEDTSMTTTKPLGSTTDSQKTREEVVSLASSEAKDHGTIVVLSQH